MTANKLEGKARELEQKWREEAQGWSVDGFNVEANVVLRFADELAAVLDTARQSNTAKHVYWGPGEPECPKDIKADNGELHTRRCKVCDLDNPKTTHCNPDAEEDAFVIDKLARLLAEIAIALKGPEPPLTRWSYHDLPKMVRELVAARQSEGMVCIGWEFNDPRDELGWQRLHGVGPASSPPYADPVQVRRIFAAAPADAGEG